MINYKKVAIITTAINFDLYKKSNPLFDERYDRYMIDGRDGMHGMDSISYMIKKMKNLDYDYLIMSDEDFFLKSNENLELLIEEMERDNITISGVRDGGVLNHRKFNPFCINTFFSIINLKTIKKYWNKKEVLSNQKINDGEFVLDEILPFKYDENSLFESYYCFYLWSLRKGLKIKYLISKHFENEDTVSNTVYLKENQVIGYHSWYARSYGLHEGHTQRIDKILKMVAPNKTTKSLNYVIWKDYTYKYSKSINKFLKKVYLKFSSSSK
ncbi:hypothetical protein DUT90_08070 [Polaribacter sp. WD7]|uniref:hypothetical protein n=1 Tax=Polaribacter sp. WD7 TaxID=2269061 RepID=UPI000DF40C17|nr:hypothetical protein [Polaribacter sp. WD7]RCS27060.1 hypothetical protein DUT90_08070 [Polaribacter sp. WD7]